MYRKPYHRYANIPNNVVPDPPFGFQRALFFSFVLTCDQDNMDELIDNRLNKASGFNVRFKATAPIISVIFALYPGAYPLHGKKQIGYVPYREVLFMMMVRERRPFWSRNNNLYSYQPAILLDENVATTSGREIFGWSKMQGELFFPGVDGPDQKSFLGMCKTFPGKAGPEALATPIPFIEIEAPPTFSMPDLERHVTSDPKALIGKYVAQQIDQDSKTNINLNLSSSIAEIHEMPVVTFRQFPDPERPGYALSKSVVKTIQKNITITNGGILDGDYYIKNIIDTQMFPIGSVLGLNPRILASYWFEWSFELHRGESLWDARGPALPWFDNFLSELFG